MESTNLMPKTGEPVILETKEREFQADFEELKNLLKLWAMQESEPHSGDTKVVGPKSLGDFIEERKAEFGRKLTEMMEKYSDHAEQVRDEIFRISQDADFTHIRNNNELTYFAAEVRGLFPQQFDEYSEL